MIKSPLFLVATALLTGAAARADVAWQHTGRVSMGSGNSAQTLLKFDFNNQWSGANHRTFLKYDATGMSGESAEMGTPMMSDEKMAKGELTFIERLDDDRLIVAIPGAESYIDEPYSTLKERTRLNIWEGIDSTLGNGPVPELNNEQRERLGHEVRASLSPFTRRLTRIYYRVLPKHRTIKGLDCRGYRLSFLVNTSGKAKSGNWARMNAEWWLAEQLPGDQEILDFTQRANKVKTDGGPASQSMWINEYFPVLWQVAPPEIHQALRSIIGYEGNSDYGFQGTPVQFFVTVQEPKAPSPMSMMSGEAIRFALELKDRSTTAVTPAIFEAPKKLKKQPIEPFLQMTKNYVKQAREKMEKQLDKEFGPKQIAR